MGRVHADLDDFIAQHDGGVIEGCHGELIERAAHACTELDFLGPGREACLANNRRRPWEPHKYDTPRKQDAMLGNLQAWAAGYYERDDAWSHVAHQRIYEAHAGAKAVHTSLPRLD